MGMLILTRRKGDAIILGDSIKVIVLSVDGNNVRLGIDAPADVSVHRKEIYDKMMEENGKASSLAKEIREPIDAE